MDQSTGLPRKLTAVSTAGAMGQLYTVYEKNWFCTDCGMENYPSRPKCSRCKKSKPAPTAEQYVQSSLPTAGTAWQEVMDPNSYHIYYYNRTTGVTQWERPAELGQAPAATGWFGRGQAGAAQIYMELNKTFLSRAARKQKDFVDPNKFHLEGAQEYNIWYGRFIGDDFDNNRSRDPAADRCVVTKDAGWTRADGVDPKTGQVLAGGAKKRSDTRRFFCLHFARGMCAKGADCLYYHRIPLPDDDARCDELYDCFGRARHNKHREDMNGTGSFMKPCRTLFVGGLVKQKYNSPKELEDACWKHFAEWGELENVNVIHRLSIAFPRYRLRTSAG